MSRLTVFENGRYYVKDVDEAVKKLASYENLREKIEQEQAEIAEKMEALRNQGKQKTVQYRELFGRKLQNSLLLERLP